MTYEPINPIIASFQLPSMLIQQSVSRLSSYTLKEYKNLYRANLEKSFPFLFHRSSAASIRFWVSATSGDLAAARQRRRLVELAATRPGAIGRGSAATAVAPRDSFCPQQPDERRDFPVP